MAQKPRAKPTTTPEQEGIELHPDSWRRFEETVDKVLSGDPVHRTGKPTGEDRQKGRGRASAKSNR